MQAKLTKPNARGDIVTYLTSTETKKLNDFHSFHYQEKEEAYKCVQNYLFTKIFNTITDYIEVKFM